MSYTEMAKFLRSRREALQPEDVGLARGTRRRTPGLRREEVASLAVMSTDYYSRLESGESPQPSEPMLAAIARALHLTLDERDHLFLLAGHGIPVRTARTDHVSPGLMRIFDRLEDTPAMILNRISETLAQTRTHVALEGDHSAYTGLERSAVVRWFADPASQEFYDESMRANHSRVLVSKLQAVVVEDGPHSRAAQIRDHLIPLSEPFRALWEQQPIGIRHNEVKHFRHPTVGPLHLHCDMLHDTDQSQTLLVFTAEPGSPSQEALKLLTVIGIQNLAAKS
jgi:transcriptional regulator with XRE-family HTH domain